MKKLLTTITLSALVGTSASNLKPMFTNTITNRGVKSNQLNNKDINITNENDINPFVPKQLINGILNNVSITSVSNAPNGTIWVVTEKGLCKSTNGINFEQVINNIPSNVSITSVSNAPNGTIWVGGFEKGLWKSTDGNHFEQITGLPNDVSITSVAVAPDGTVWVGIEDFGVAIYKSTDGINFELVITSKISNPPNCIDISKDGTIWVGVGSGLWKSTDGINFNKIINKIINSIAIAPNGTIYVGTNSHSLWKSTDGNHFEQVTGLPNDVSITSVAVAPDGNIYASTNLNNVGIVYKSNGKNDFTKISEIISAINILVTDKVGNLYVRTDNKGLWIINPINLLVNINKPDTFDKSWPLYKGIVYKSVQKIEIQDKLVASAKLDNKSITIPTTDLDITVGEHNLVLTLKDKTLASFFGGNTSTGQVTYKLWVKKLIDKNQIDYQTKIDDTQLYTGLVSNAGNTNGTDIIQTKSKEGTGNHDASINIHFKDTLIDYKNSYFVQGIVDNSNDFAETTTHQNFSKFLSIQNDGTYHFHLVDTVGNTYDSYLELGESNWKLKGTFNDSELDKLKTKLNVTVNLTDPNQKTKALGWLQQYDNFVKNKFNDTIKTNGKGFDTEIKNQITSYILFLKLLTYDIANEPKFDDGLDKSELVTTITDKANKILNKGLNELPKHLNIDTRNVVNKSTLDNYSIWIKGYDTFINNNKDKWINDVAKVASRGFATTEQENLIKDKIRNLLDNSNIKNYLKNIVWEDNKLLKATSSGYQQYVKLEKLKNYTIDWVNTNMKDINIAYQQAINDNESRLNLHGYSIDEILNGKQKPQTKNKIDNFADGQSYHEWLQSQANMKFKGYQLAMGFGIGVPLLLIAAAIGWVIRSRTNPKYNPIARGKKIQKEKMKTKKEEMKNNNKEK